MVADVATSVDLADEESIDTDFAVDLQEALAAGFDAMSEDDRLAVAHLIAAYADEQPDPERRQNMLDLPEALGLVDDGG
jgi:hypothetical protein